MAQLSNSSSPAAVIGIGASAGGVEALTAFLDHASHLAGSACLIVMHLAVGHPSHLSEILARHTSMTVVRAESGMPIERNTIYVMPQGQVMTVVNGTLQLAPTRSDERVPTVIDRLFDSLASCYGERAMGVVLSGTGADGTLGLKAIKECGGLTIAQSTDGSSPMFASMPQSAISAGVVDIELPVADIPERLAAAISEGQNHEPRKTARLNAIRREICATMLAEVGHDFSGYKPNTFFRRVHRRMHVLQIDTLENYLSQLKQNSGEVTLLFRDLLISVTSFFRDAASFALLEKHVLPALFQGKSAHSEVRVWVPACATGEEAYSLGILLIEQAERLGDSAPSLRVFATDIDERSLTIARRGSYPSVLMSEVSAARRDKFFTEDRGHFSVNKALRNICTFSPHNALRDPPFSRIDLVSCRNLLIYLGIDFQDRIMPIFHYALRPDGFLFVGIAEGAARHSSLFAPISKDHRIFSRLPGPPGNLPLPLLSKNNPMTTRHPFVASPHGASTEALRRQIEARILQAHAPAHILVDAQGDALFYSGRTSNYLEFPAGAPSRHLLSNARKELRIGLRHGLLEVAREQTKVDLPDISMLGNDGLHRIQISIEPLNGDAGALYLVIFNDHGMGMSDAGHGSGNESLTVEQMERELRDTREQLQSTHEEFETAIEELRITNEELMSVNEELQSSNEELETSKEELQSVNEELQTVNNEMVRHVEALDQANADLRGLLESTGIATIFLDRRLAIRSFTQAATEIFTMIPTDRGRLITDIAHRLEDFDLHEKLTLTLLKHQPIELRIQRKDGSKHYLMCALPYAGTAEETSGVVITFVDVTELAKADTRHKMMIGELNHRVRNMLAVVSAMATQTLRPVVEEGGLNTFIDRLHAMARTYKLLTETNWSHMLLQELLRVELGAIVGTARYTLSGPSIRLDPREALALGMVFHELATNALKYGALFNDAGRVDVSWEIDAESGLSVQICWKESGGPLVGAPSHRGFGTLLLDRQLAYELNGQSSVNYFPDGLVVVMKLPRLSHPSPA